MLSSVQSVVSQNNNSHIVQIKVNNTVDRSYNSINYAPMNPSSAMIPAISIPVKEVLTNPEQWNPLFWTALVQNNGCQNYGTTSTTVYDPVSGTYSSNWTPVNMSVLMTNFAHVSVTTSTTTSPAYSPVLSQSVSQNSINSESESGFSSRSVSPARSSSISSQSENVHFPIYVAGKYRVVSNKEFHKVLNGLLKVYVHTSAEITQIYDPTKPNKYKKNMINGIMIWCSVSRGQNIRDGFKPDLTMLQKKLESEYPLFSDLSLFNEDPLDINRAVDKSKAREAYAHYHTSLQCNTEKISIGNFDSSEDLNDFLDDLREAFYPHAQEIDFLKVVYTKKKNVFKTFYITSCFGKNAAKQCKELHKALNKLGVQTYHSKNQKKQAQRRNFTM